MPEYYWLYHDPEITERWFLGTIKNLNAEKVLPITFTQGLPIDATQKFIVDRFMPGKPLDFTFQTHQVPIVRLAVADIMEKLEHDAVQRLPVTITPDLEGFEILNIIRAIDCLDIEKSQFERFGDLHPEKQGQISVISKLRILSELVNGHHIFRLGEWKLAIIVSETLKSALEQEGFTGMIFLPA